MKNLKSFYLLALAAALAFKAARRMMAAIPFPGP
jgi:hypothetical protein